MLTSSLNRFRLPFAASIPAMLGCFGFVFCYCAAMETAQSQATVASLQTDQTDLKNAKPKKPPTNQKEKRQPVAEERIQALLAFTGQHHPEIQPLLQVLKKKRPARYQRVMHGLDNEVRSLERIKKRSPKSYPLALAQWVNRSKIRLLSAQVSTSKSVEDVEKIRVQIRQLLKKNQETRLTVLNRDIQDAQTRLERIEKMAKDLQDNGDAIIEKRVQSVTKLPAKLRKPNKNRQQKSDKRRDSQQKSDTQDKKGQ